jgi:hypothetical protein
MDIVQINPLKLSGYCMYHLLLRTTSLHFVHRVHPCVWYGSQNKQLLFP